MKRIFILSLVLISFLFSNGEESNTDLTKQVEEQVKTKFLDGDKPLRYSSNILIRLHGNPTKVDSLIFQEFVVTLNALIDKWDVYLIPKGTSNLVVELNDPYRKDEPNKIIEQGNNSGQIVKRTLVLNIPTELDSISRKKVICYYLMRSLVTFKDDHKNIKPIPGSIFSEDSPAKIELLPVDFRIIKELYSEKNEPKANEDFTARRSVQKVSLAIFLSLIAFLFSFSFLIFMSLKGNFNDHNYKFKSFFRQGFLVVLASAIYSFVSLTYTVFPLIKTQNIIILPIIILVYFAVGIFLVCLIFLLERTILRKFNGFSMEILIPFLSIILVTGFLLFLFLLLIPYKVPRGLYSSAIYSAIFYSSIVGFGRSIYIFTRKKSESIIHKKDVELAKMSELHKQAELQSLRAKINPHFLYNALNSIASLAVTDARKTEQMALALSDFFKYAINREQKQLNTLSEELNATRTYLEIEKVRFGDRLSFEIDCPEELLEIQIPQLLIQPLVENAIKHGLSQITENGLIQIIVRKEENQLKIQVSDNGPAFPEGPLSGFGIQNTVERITLLYGTKAKINWQNGEDKHVELSLPFVNESVKKD